MSKNNLYDLINFHEIDEVLDNLYGSNWEKKYNVHCVPSKFDNNDNIIYYIYVTDLYFHNNVPNLISKFFGISFTKKYLWKQNKKIKYVNYPDKKRVILIYKIFKD